MIPSIRRPAIAPARSRYASGRTSSRVSAHLTLVLAIAVALGSLGCRKEERQAFESKCDASLRLRVEQLASSAPDSLLDVLGSTSGPIDDARRQKLGKAGAQLGSVSEDKFTARIPVKRVAGVAVLDFVTSLALAQTREPLGP